MTHAVIDAIREHAKTEYPRECCGLVVVERGKPVYVPCTNMADTPAAHFAISPAEYDAAEQRGAILKVVHSHPDISPQPSEADRVSCELSGLPWLIVNWPTGQIVEFEPSGYKAPLIGRTFSHAVLDCYSLIRDYYRETLAIDLIDFQRREEWWLKGDNLYLDGFGKAGFVEVQDMAEHDVLLMQIGSPVINHAAVYIGNNQILQHCAGRLSSRDVYGGGWRRATIKIVRHTSLC
ncbi:MAG: peptidase P60 [Thiomonas sp. 20-64-5]|nr:MAG: peptidase P60 [Thiomonas sp. 20-64-5]